MTRRQQAEIEARIEDIEERAVRIAHQLRTPISIADGYCRIAASKLEELRREDPQRSEAERLSEIQMLISRAIDVMGDLNSSVDDLGKGYSSGDLVRAHYSSIHDLRKIVEESIEETKLVAERDNKEVSIEGPSVLVRCDLPRIKQVIYNLILRSCRDGSADKITFRLDKSSREAILSVSDGAPVLTEAQLTMIFSNSTHISERDSDPVGPVVGLTIAQSIVTSHGGVMTVTSTTYHGNEIKIRIPAVSIGLGPATVEG
jgi:signal transduction histidine kinase